MSSDFLRPAPADETAHPPTPEPLWNESWYFDFVDAGADLGGWVRLGLYPNEGQAWVNALVCGPGRPTVALNDFHAPIPSDPTKVRADGFALTQHVDEPMQTYRVTATGQGQAYDDPAALLAGEAGRPVPVALDLTWSTAGSPRGMNSRAR